MYYYVTNIESKKTRTAVYKSAVDEIRLTVKQVEHRKHFYTTNPDLGGFFRGLF